MKIENPFHAGELEAQRRAGESGAAERNSAVISDTIIAGALPFLRQQTMVVLGTEGDDGARWASPLLGPAGFVNAEDERTLFLDRRRMLRVDSDVVWDNLHAGARVGMLAIELATRRRLRVNGIIARAGDDGFILAVREAYPNCPKYIQRRALKWDSGASPLGDLVPSEGAELSQDSAQALRAADTLFICSGHAGRGLDVSHRGGNPGFVRVLSPSAIRIPDYAGNSMFNSFGNILTDARAGISVMDFAASRILQMTGKAAVEWNQPDEQGVAGGTGRFLTFEIDRWRMLPLPRAARWEYFDASPFNPGVG